MFYFYMQYSQILCECQTVGNTEIYKIGRNIVSKRKKKHYGLPSFLFSDCEIEKHGILNALISFTCKKKSF